MNTSLYGGLIEISPDGQPIAPDLVLAYRGGTKQGIIHHLPIKMILHKLLKLLLMFIKRLIMLHVNYGTTLETLD